MEKGKSVKRKIKWWQLLMLIGLCLVCLSLVFHKVDSDLAKQQKKPVFSIAYGHANDGGTTLYLGLGYQIIQWHQLGDEPGYYYIGSETYYWWESGLFPTKSPQVPLELVYEGP